MKRWLGPVVVLLILLAGCGRGDVGESCDTSGKEDECVDEAICTKGADGTNTCRKRCTEDSQCGSADKCNGVSATNIKSCQPK